MFAIIKLIIFFGVLLAVPFYRFSLKTSTAIIGGLLLVFSIFHLWSWWILLPLWIIYILTAVVFNVSSLRIRFVSQPIFKKFKILLPPMSETERTALEAGDNWWEEDLFRGAPDWQKLNNLPVPTLTAEEKAFIDNQVETLCDMLQEWKIVYEDADLSPQVWDYLKRERFWGLIISKEFGGLGFSALAHSTIVSKIASRSYTTALTVMVPNSLGPAELLIRYGTPEQKNYYLPRLAVGEEIPCFGLTNPKAGSDATSIPDSGIVCKGMFKGKEVIGIKLNWDKHYITLAPIATLLGIAFKLHDPDHLLGDQENIGITLVLVPSDVPGVEIGKRHLPMRFAFMNGPTRGKDVFVPLDYIIGGPEMRGKGWQMLMECLAVGRGISLPSLATAACKLSYRMGGAYSRVRYQFKMPIGQLEGVQEALARIGGLTYIAEASRIFMAGAIDEGLKPSLASAITKFELTELGRIAVRDAMDIHGGKGLQMGPHNYLGFIYAGAPISVTVEGANILTRNLIIFGQGAVRCHPYIFNEMMAAKNPDVNVGLKLFDPLLTSHVGYLLTNKIRALVYGITGGKFISAPTPDFTAKYYRQLTRMSTALAFLSDAAMIVLGGELKRRERISARLADIHSNLYLASAVLKYFDAQGRPNTDVVYVKWSLEWCLAAMQQAIDEFCRNFPKKLIGYCLRRWIFPWGTAYRLPKDNLGQQIAESMLQNSSFRDRITKYCYVGKTADDATGSIEFAFKALLAAEPILLKLRNAIRSGRVPRHASRSEQIAAASQAGILTAEEIQCLQEAERLQDAAIRVDEFEPEYLSARAKKESKKKEKLV